MFDAQGPYRIGALFIGLSGLMHLAAPLLGGFAGQAITLAGVGAIYLLIAAGLLRGWRWLAYLAFLVMLVALSAAIPGIFGQGPVPGWLFGGILVANLLAVLGLFAALWRRRPTPG